MTNHEGTQMNFKDVTTVNFQGLVVAFARGDAPTGDPGEGLLATDIYYNVLALEVDSQSDAADWTGFQPLTLPDAVRPAGMNLINVPVTYNATQAIDALQDADQPFRVVTNQEYIYLFRQAKRGSLLVNRLRLVRQTGAANAQEVVFALEPAWEVRFQRSAKPDMPADVRDSQGYLSPERAPFIEPAFELVLGDDVVDGRFDVQFLPRGEGTLLNCAVFVTTGPDVSKAYQMSVYELPLDTSGVFTLAGKTLKAGRIAPDFGFQLCDSANKPLTLLDRPSTTFYLKQERVLGAEGGSYTVKRSGRMLIAHRAGLPSDSTPVTLATVDLAVAADGLLARPAAMLQVDPVGVANYSLEFDHAAWVELPVWAPKQHYSVDLWIYPTATQPLAQQILGPSNDTDAPFLRMVDGNALEAGFMGKNGKPLSARTTSGTIRQYAWTRVQVSFDAAASPKYRFVINGTQTPCQIAGDGDHPSLGQINAISAPVNGFMGCIDHFIAYDGAGWDPATRVGDFAFDTIDYIGKDQLPLDPPLTPNQQDSDPAMWGKVRGARLVPSTSPQAVQSGALSWDQRGLTIYSSYFKDLQQYGELASSPFLLAGSDGRVHCYFRGESDVFSVMQLDTENARATFETTWSTRDANAETGRVQFVSMQSGAYMNSAAITVVPPDAGLATALFCKLLLASPSGVTETWRGVPRGLGALSAVLAGDCVADPADPRLRTGERTYFDPSGTRSAAWLPLDNSPGHGTVALVSRGPKMPLTEVHVQASGLTLRFAPPHWPATQVNVVWPTVPLDVGAFIDTLDGGASRYAYDKGGAIDAAAYSLAASSGLVGANRVVVFVKPGSEVLKRISITTNADSLLCDVAIELGTLTAKWRDVPRDQVAFADVIEGVATARQYDYRGLASGDYANIGAALVLFTDGAEALLQNVELGGKAPPTPETDLRISAGLLSVFSTAPNDTAATVPVTAQPVAAGCYQSALQTGSATGSGQPRAVSATDPVVLTNGSQLFRAIPMSVPVQGGAGMVDDTAAAAPLTLQGFSGGWLNQPQQRTLDYQWDNWVGFETDEAKAPNIGALTITGDMSLELWCRPERAADLMLQPYQRLLTFSRAPAGSEDKVRYLAGLNDCPSLSMSAGSRIRAAFNTTRGTLYTWFRPTPATGGAAPTGIIGSISTLGVVTPVLQLQLGADGKLAVSFELDTKQAPITTLQAIDTSDWHQAAVTFVSTFTKSGGQYHYTFDIQLYVDGHLQGTAQYKIDRDPTSEIDLATAVLGDIVASAGLPMQVNEAAFFGDVLIADDFERFAEQRIPDNADDLVFKWMLIEGTGDNAVNSAVSGALYDAPVEPSASWLDAGLYSRPLLAHGDIAAVMTGDPVIHGWTHLAMVHQAGYAVALQGREYGNAGNDESLNLGESFSLEAWVELTGSSATSQQTLVAKGHGYALTVDTAGRPTFAARVSIGDQEQTLSLVAPNPIGMETPTYLAARFETITVVATDGQGSVPRYEVHMALFANGQQVAWGMQDGNGKFKQYTDPVQRVLGHDPVNLGRSSLLNGSAYLRGRLADVRLWSRCLTPVEIAQVQADRRVPRNTDGLVSWWRFNEDSGRVAFDAKGDNNVTWTRGDLRRLFPATANNDFFVNGARASAVDYLDSTDSIGGYGDQDSFLFAQGLGALSTGFHGQLADVRIWNVQLTQEQIADSMNRPPAGTEPNLRGYWNFSSGSGTTVEDRTGRGNDGTLNKTGANLPTWRPSTAPLGDESAEVLGILGGTPTYAQRDISDTPSVIEYADVQRDAYGTTISVMKRAYASIRDQKLTLLTGFKVGDLDTVYIGQAQSRPTLVGYIEGAPPIPSENQTLPYWRGGFGEINAYAGASQVSFTEADNTVYAYNASRDVADTHAFSIKGGLYGGGQYATSAGIGFEVETPIVVFEGHLGAQTGFELTEHRSHGIGTQSGTTQTFATGLRPGGSWESGNTPDQWVNPTVGRRYLPSNTGTALVKSLTVDVYASILRSTGAMVKMSMVPNPDIPVDVNLIDFPIDPTYIKNGTLDGKVGLRNDPNYPDADLQRGSYFKPLEGYALKRRIERQSAQLESYYQQYDVASYAGKLKGNSDFETYRNTVRDNTAYDWSQHLSKRSIVNTYVWTAGGGSYAEQTQPMNVYSEQHGAISSSQISGGAVGDIQMGFPVAGFYLDFDYLYSSATEVNVVKSKEQGSSFDLAAETSPESYLFAPIIDGDNVTFAEIPTEGKVDGYRYQAFMLAADASNGTTFFERVVDPNWLHNSNDSNAAALREASSTAAGPWRVLYRVTYVSRIPPRFQPAAAQTLSPDLQPPANLAYNTMLVQLVVEQIGTVKTPNSLQIGTAIGKVLGTAAAPGTLAASLPWWPQFLTDAAGPTLPAGQILRTLREDLLQYMIDTYASAGDVA